MKYFYRIIVFLLCISSLNGMNTDGVDEWAVQESFKVSDFIAAGDAMTQVGNQKKADTYYGDAVYFLLTDFFYPQYMAAALESGIFDELAKEAQTIHVLSVKLELDHAMLDLLLRTLGKLQLVEKDGALFNLTFAGNTCLKNKDLILFVTSQIYDDWGQMTDVFNGQKTFTMSVENEERVTRFFGNTIWRLPYTFDDEREVIQGDFEYSIVSDIALGFINSQVVALGVTCGIFAAIDNGVNTVDKLFCAIHWHASQKKLIKVLEHLQSLQLISSRDGYYRLNPVGRVLLKDNRISLYHGAHIVSKEFYATWRHCLHTLKTGTCALNCVYQKGFFDYLDLHPERRTFFSEYMGETMRTWLLPLSHKYLFAGKIIDLGGADGSVLTSIVRDNPAVTQAVNFERRGYFTDRERRPGIEQLEGDFFERVPDGYDLYLVSRVFWDWDNGKVIKLLKNIHQSMSDNARLLIVDGILEECDSKGSLGGAMFSPIVTDGGRVRSLVEYKELYAATGFELISYRRVHDSAMALSLMELKKVSNTF